MKDTKRLELLEVTCQLLYVSVDSKPDHPLPRATSRDLHILVVPGVGVLLLCVAQGSAWGS